MRRLATILCLTLAALAGMADAQTRADGSNRVTVNRGGDDRSTPLRRGAEVSLARSRRPEWLVYGTPAQATAAEVALVAAGATLLRRRSLPTLNRQISVFDLNRLDPEDADVLTPGAAISPNHIYRFAQGGTAPRLYAATLIGDVGCRLSSSARIGIIDGPVNTRHPALADAAIRTVDTLGDLGQPDGVAHGTAVAGLIVGQDGGLDGFAPGATLFAANAFGKARGGPAADAERVAASLDWLAGQRVRVINMSFAGPQNGVLGDVLGLTAGRGTVLVAAMGNTSKKISLYPAASPHVVAVTAVDAARRGYRKATTGPHAELSAPGVDVFVAKAKGAGYASGTSYAAPIVTAFAARHAARGRGPRAIRRDLAASAQDLGPAGRDQTFGFGLVRAPTC